MLTFPHQYSLDRRDLSLLFLSVGGATVSCVFGEISRYFRPFLSAVFSNLDGDVTLPPFFDLRLSENPVSPLSQALALESYPFFFFPFPPLFTMGRRRPTFFSFPSFLHFVGRFFWTRQNPLSFFDHYDRAVRKISLFLGDLKPVSVPPECRKRQLHSLSSHASAK